MLRSSVTRQLVKAVAPRAYMSVKAVFRTLYKSPDPVGSAGHPTGRTGHGVSRLGNHVLMFGGDASSPPNGTAVDDFWSLSLSKSDQWSPVKALNAGPSARFGHTSNGKENSLSVYVLTVLAWLVNPRAGCIFIAIACCAAERGI